MPWIKKNLMLVLGGLVGLILLGGSAFFFFAEAGRESEVNTKLEEKRAEWDRLNSLNPFPDEKNIKATKDDAARVKKISEDLRASLKPVEVQPVSDTFSLRLLIETSISELTKEAENAGVNLPDKYAFTFQKLRDMGGQFDSNSIPKLAEQMAQIRTICDVLYRAKVHSLDTLRRSPVLKDEGTGSDYLTKKSVTNNLVVRTPYDLTFRAFSGELAAVMRGFAGLDHLVVIKTLNIDPTTLPSVSSGAAPVPMMTMTPSAPGMPPGGGMGMDPALRARYGLGGGGRPGEGGGEGAGGMDAALRARYGGMGGGGEAAMRSRYGVGGGGGLTPPPALSAPMAPPTGAPAAPAGPTVVLDEKPLRVIMQIDFVKPKPAPETGRRAAPKPAAGDAPAADAPAAE